jgi:acyl dehydratase
MAEAAKHEVEFDTSDVDRWIGVPLGGSRARWPVNEIDIARWAQAMHNPNPLYFDEDYARGSRWGKIVAPFSFTVACGDGHGATPAIQGHVEGTHMLFGGDEWWFYGPRVLPGDRLNTDRMLFDYKVSHTKFAGPTMFSRGDTNYVNQTGEFVAKQRSTSIRYRADEARRLNSFAGEEEDPDWMRADEQAVQKEKAQYYDSFLSRGHAPRLYKDVAIGTDLPRCVIGPHSLMSFTTEHRSRPTSVWGATIEKPGPSSLWNAGWLPEMDRDHAAAQKNPEMGDGLYHGPSRGHVQPVYARLIGMPRGYGYGSTMGGWVLDYIENWAGEWGFVRHSWVQYRNPAFTGDVTYIEGRVGEKRVDPQTGWQLVTIHVTMKTQKGAQMARGYVDLELADPEDSTA